MMTMPLTPVFMQTLLLSTQTAGDSIGRAVLPAVGLTSFIDKHAHIELLQAKAREEAERKAREAAGQNKPETEAPAVIKKTKPDPARTNDAVVIDASFFNDLSRLVDVLHAHEPHLFNNRHGELKRALRDAANGNLAVLFDHLVMMQRLCGALEKPTMMLVVQAKHAGIEMQSALIKLKALLSFARMQKDKNALTARGAAHNTARFGRPFPVSALLKMSRDRALLHESFFGFSGSEYSAQRFWQAIKNYAPHFFRFGVPGDERLLEILQTGNTGAHAFFEMIRVAIDISTEDLSRAVDQLIAAIFKER
ncbi:MAG: hypothetical protein HQM16_05935 [Deltaproteobacteria bacterium]|nr:hypothetical protein [Deltaproteobacteria bacterium]